jgi:hypothetical protein
MANLRKAIDAHCKECIYDKQGEGSWIEQVTNCTAYDCNLFPVRPISAGYRVDVKQLVKYERKAARNKK